MIIQNDLDINRAIRQVLVKHWIDLGRLFIKSSRGKVTIHGILDRITGTKEDLSSALVETIVNEIQHVRGVERVTIDFVNWKRVQGGWAPVEQEIKVPHGKAQTTESQYRQTAYDIGGEKKQ